VILERYEKIDKQYDRAAAIADILYEEVYLPLKAEAEKLFEIDARGRTLAALNRYVKFGGTP